MEVAGELAAGALARLAAFVLDLIVVGFLFAPLLLLGLGRGFLHLWTVASLEFFGYVVYFSYLEGRRGATLGKELLGMRVLREDLEPPTYWQALVRGLARASDLAFLGIPMLIRRDRRRLGDVLAGTFVIDEKKVALALPTPRRFEFLKRTGGRAWERDRAIVEGLIGEVRERLEREGSDVAREVLRRIAARRGVSEDEAHRQVTSLLGLSEDDWRVGVVAYGLMSGIVTFKRESLAKRSASVLRRASRLASRIEDRVEFEARARALRSLAEMRSGGRKPRILPGLAQVIGSAPEEFRSSAPFFLAAVLILLSGLGLGYWVGTGFAEELRRIFGPPGGAVAANPALLTVAIAMNNVRVDLGVLLGGGPAIYPVLLMLLTNGAVVGALAAHSAASSSWLTFLSLVVAHGLGELTLFLVAAAGGMKIAWGLFFPGRDRSSAILSARRAVSLPLFSAILLPAYAVIEAFLTPRLEGRPMIALAIGVITAAPVYAWLLLGGRGGGEGEEGAIRAEG